MDFVSYWKPAARRKIRNKEAEIKTERQIHVKKGLCKLARDTR